jgi:hypothetical protein
LWQLPATLSAINLVCSPAVLKWQAASASKAADFLLAFLPPAID